jgi:hypothetical protein
MLSLPEKYSKCAENLEKDAKPVGTLYHYTTWGGLTGMLNTQQLWLTHYSQLNDTSEIFHSLEAIRNFIFSIVPNGNERLFWEALFEDIQNLIAHEYDFFVGSFCMRANYLYAWRDYADDGAGFSIGFKKEFFLGVSSKVFQPDAPPFGRSRVYYNFNHIENDIRYLVKIVHEDLNCERALENTDKAVIKRLEIAKYFMSSLLPFLSALKHNAYEGEHEHRIYISMPRSVSLQTFYTHSGDAGKPHLNSKKRVYFQFDLENISEIWVGPRLNFEHAKYDIERAIQSLKNNSKAIGEIKIVPSGIPYKNR